MTTIIKKDNGSLKDMLGFDAQGSFFYAAILRRWAGVGEGGGSWLFQTVCIPCVRVCARVCVCVCARLFLFSPAQSDAHSSNFLVRAPVRRAAPTRPHLAAYSRERNKQQQQQQQQPQQQLTESSAKGWSRRA